jgi:DNA polymerase IV
MAPAMCRSDPIAQSDPELDLCLYTNGVNLALISVCRDCFIEQKAHTIAVGQKCDGCGSRRIVFHTRLNALSIAHIDCDAFYAAIHKRDQPELRDKPVIVGGGVRGVVATCCYIARASGVRSAMPMFKALKLCPEAVVIKPQMELYSREGRAIRTMMQDLTPLVEPVSVDEAYLDLSGTDRLHGCSPAVTLAKFQRTVEAETGLTVSVGLSSNKFLAKTASDLDKPRGFAVLAPEDVPEILWGRPVGFLHGVGPAFVKTLNRDGYMTIGDLAAADFGALQSRYGDSGGRVAAMAIGKDSRKVEPDSERKSISSETTFNHDLRDLEDLEPILARLCTQVGERTRASACSGRVVTLKLRTASFKAITRRITLSEPTATGRIVFEAAKPLLVSELSKGPFRLIGVGLTDLSAPADADHGDLMNTSAPRKAALERALDQVKARFGKGAVKSGA